MDILAFALAWTAAVAFFLAPSGRTRLSVLLCALVSSFVMTGWRRDVGFIVLEPSLAVIPVCLALWGASLAARPRIVALDRIGILALLVTAAAWLSYFGALDMMTWLKRAFKVSLLFGLYVFIVNCASDRRQVAALIRAGLWSSAVAGVFVTVQLARFWIEHGLVELAGAPGTFANSNEAATYLAIFIVIGLSLYASGVYGEVMSRGALMTTIALSALGVLLTRSRTGLGATLFVTAVLFARTPRVRRFVFGAVILLVVLASTPATEIVLNRLLATVNASGNPDYDAWMQQSTGERLYLLKLYWTVAKANPVFGIGAANYGFLDRLKIDLPIPPSDIGATDLEYYLHVSTHNGYMSWLVETGLPGFLVFVGSLAYSILALRRARKRWMRNRTDDAWWYAIATGVLGGLGIFVCSNFTAEFGISEARYWLLLALATIALRQMRADQKRSEGNRLVNTLA